MAWGPCSAHPPLSPADGRLRGAPPGHTGETLDPPSFTSLGWGKTPSPRKYRHLIKACACPSILQPGKLTEAFKYFLQGMGYSEYTSPQHPLETRGQQPHGAGTLCWVVPSSL